MSSSFLTKQLINDVEDMQTAFEIAKAEVDESISAQEAEITNLKSSVATHESSLSALASDKQNKLDVLSEIIVKNITTSTINNITATDFTSTSKQVAMLSSSLDSIWSATRQLQFETLKANSSIVVTRLNEMPVNEILSAVNDTNVVKSMLGDIYDSIESTLIATTVNCTNLIVDNIPFAKLPQTHIIIKTQYIKWTHDWKIEPGNESYYINKNYILMYVRFVPIYTRSHFAFCFNAAYSFDTRTTGKIEIFGKVKQFAPNYFVPTNWDNIWHSGDNNKPTFDSTEVAIEKNPLFPFSFTMPSGKNISGLEIELQIWVNNRTTSPLYMNNDDSSTYWHITEIYDPPDSGIY